MMEDDNEDDLKNKEDFANWWKAHGAGHIPLCGIFSLDMSDICLM